MLLGDPHPPGRRVHAGSDHLTLLFPTESSAAAKKQFSAPSCRFRCCTYRVAIMHRTRLPCCMTGSLDEIGRLYRKHVAPARAGRCHWHGEKIRQEAHPLEDRQQRSMERRQKWQTPNGGISAVPTPHVLKAIGRCDCCGQCDRPSSFFGPNVHCPPPPSLFRSNSNDGQRSRIIGSAADPLIADTPIRF